MATEPVLTDECLVDEVPHGLSEREVGALQLWMKSVDEKLDCLLSAWQGNGKPGIKQELMEIKGRLDDLEEWQQEVMDGLNRVAGPLVVAFLLFLAGVGWGLLTNKIEIVFH